FAVACPTKRAPSVFAPAIAKNRLPGSTVRLSAVRPVTGRSRSAACGTVTDPDGRAEIKADSFMERSDLSLSNHGGPCPARHLWYQYDNDSICPPSPNFGSTSRNAADRRIMPLTIG